MEQRITQLLGILYQFYIFSRPARDICIHFRLYHRSKYVQWFNESVAGCRFKKPKIPSIWAFLECVLDEHFLKLSTHVTNRNSSLLNPKLITMIAKRSPMINALELDFQLANRCDGFDENQNMFRNILVCRENILSIHEKNQKFQASFPLIF